MRVVKRARREEKKNPISARDRHGKFSPPHRAFLASAKRVVFSSVHSRFINCESTTYYIKKKKRIIPVPALQEGRRVIRKGAEVGGQRGIIVCEGGRL